MPYISSSVAGERPLPSIPVPHAVSLSQSTRLSRGLDITQRRASEGQYQPTTQPTITLANDRTPRSQDLLRSCYEKTTGGRALNLPEPRAIGRGEMDGHFLVGTRLFRRFITPPVPPVGETLKTTRLTWLMKTKVKELGAIGQQQVSLCWLTADFQPIHCGVAVIIILAFICLNPSVYWGFQENPHHMNMMCDGATVKDYLLLSMSFLFHLSLSFAYILTSLSMHLYQICLYRGNVDVLKLSNRWPALLRLWTSNLSN